MTRLELATSRPPDVCATNCATSRSLLKWSAKVGKLQDIAKYISCFSIKKVI